MDDAAQLWTTGVNVGSQVEKKRHEDKVLLSPIRVSIDYHDVMFTSNSYISFSVKHLHITPSGRSGLYIYIYIYTYMCVCVCVYSLHA